MFRNRILFTGLALLTLCMAATAFAQGRRGATPPRGGGAPHSRGVLGQLVFPCPAACADDARDCTESANDDAVSCIGTACPTEVTAAQDACTEDKRSEECKAAIGALAECADSCLDTYSTAVGACRTALGECREACTAE